MIPVPTVEGWSDVHCSIDKGRVERNGEGEEPRRNVPQSKGERKRVERAGGQAGKYERSDEQAVAVDEGKEHAGQGKRCRSEKQDSPWPQQSAEIHGKGADKHQRNVKGAANPCAVVETDAGVALEVGKAERNHSACQRDDSRARDDTQDPEEGTL